MGSGRSLSERCESTTPPAACPLTAHAELPVRLNLGHQIAAKPRTERIENAPTPHRPKPRALLIRQIGRQKHEKIALLPTHDPPSTTAPGRISTASPSVGKQRTCIALSKPRPPTRIGLPPRRPPDTNTTGSPLDRDTEAALHHTATRFLNTSSPARLSNRTNSQGDCHSSPVDSTSHRPPGSRVTRWNSRARCTTHPGRHSQ